METYLVCGSITETARRRNLLESGSQAGPLLGRGGFPGFGTVPDVPIPLLPKSHPISRPRSGKRENAQITEGKGFPWHLWQEEGLVLSPHTIRHILRRLGYTGRRKRRKAFYPAQWAWEKERPFALVQVDVKNILDKGTLGTKLWDHIRKKGLPLYQWTFLEGRTRLRFLAWSHELSLTNGMCF